jgi:Ca2+-binding RTX toxin-like protein
MLHALEHRFLLSLAVSLEDGQLTVVGTERDDRIEIVVESKRIKVKFAVDEVDFSAPSAKVQTIIVRGRLGDDRITIDRSVSATAQLFGGGGHDLLIGGRKPGQLHGEAGHDTLIGGFGRDVFSGGVGIDTVDYSARASAVWVTLDGKPNDGTIPKKKSKGERDNVGQDIENVIGGAGHDRIVGNELRNVLRGGAGDDTLLGGAGDDVLVGDDGADLLFGDAGDDVLIAIDRSTSDKLDGGEGYDAAAFDYILAELRGDSLLEIENEVSVLNS